MDIVRYEHACVRLTTDSGAVLVVDPGELTAAAALDGADAVLYTHAHYDHFGAGLLSALPGLDALPVIGPAALGEAVAAAGASLTALAPGGSVTVAGVPVRAIGGVHAEIFPGSPTGANLGLVFGDDEIYHPGDALVAPEGAVGVGLLPVYAPWARLSDFAAFADALPAELLVPIHDGFLTGLGQTSVDRNITSVLPGRNYRRLAVGESLSGARV
jgi:L-ascorbate metabolism protein UlaG (beta-lactamase superfamily)